MNRSGASRRRPGERGFTVLEMMIAMAVLGITLIGMAQLLGLAVEASYFSRFNVSASQVARGHLETLKARYDAQLTSGASASDLAPGLHGPETITVGEEENAELSSVSFSIVWEVTDLGGVEKLLSVTVKPLGVDDPETAGLKRKTVTMSALLAP